MGHNATAARIGIFVIFAATLMVIGIIMFSSDQFFSKHDRYVTVFRGSVQGLAKGSPVSFQGVKIGEVVDVRIHYSAKNSELLVPVVMDVSAELLDNFFEGVAPKDMERANRGIRAKLVTQSMVTGRLMVQIDYEPEQQGELHPTDLNYPQIPTVPSDLELVRQALSSTLSKVAKMPLDEIANNLNELLGQVKRITESPKFNRGVDSLEEASVQLNALLTRLNQDLPALSQQMQVTLGDFQQTAKNVSHLSQSAEALVDTSAQTIAQGNETLAKIDQTLAQAEATLLTYQQLADHDSQLKVSAEQSLNNLNATLKSARSLLDTLQRRPEAVIFGK
ncbi:MCE family protein [Corallincola luteus]|uniref:MCE family protein n=1 Tax=Corallincola luteus TaxID=1775177 RepID=A0ABY2AG00_9GAMM|nr:MlaD family protein [Corallincola luteus]TCI01403.1 MCE family protein [Corallincola luteus]